MTKSRVFFILSLSFIAGVFGASFYYPGEIENFHLLGTLVLALIFLVIFYKNKKVALASFAVMFFIFGVYFTGMELGKIKNLDQDGKNFSGTAMIIKEPEDNEKYQKIIIRPDVWAETETSDVQMRKRHPTSRAPLILLNVFEGSKYAYGDKLKVECALKIPENFSPEFDYRMYLAKDSIFYECQKPKIENLEVNEGNPVYKFILGVKNKFNDKIEKFIPAPESGLVSGLLLGGDDLLSEEWQEKFSITGMTHIVAVSGYNVAIIAEYLMLLGIFLGLWRRQAFWFAAIGIGLFVFMIGLPASAVRAGVMGTLLLFAMKNGRLANSENAILFSASIMLLINPLLLRWDVGFQLSFLATLGIIYLYPIASNYLVKNNKVFGLSEILFLTLSAQIFVLPIILFNFQRLSLISPLANLLVLPIIPLAMLLGFLAAAAGFIFEPLAVVVSWFAYLPLKYETVVISFLAGLKYASIEVRLAWWGVIVWYIILMGIIFIVNKKKQIT